MIAVTTLPLGVEGYIAVNPTTLSWINPSLQGIASYGVTLDGVDYILPIAVPSVSFNLTLLTPFNMLKQGAHTLRLIIISTAGYKAYSPLQTFYVGTIPIGASPSGTPDPVVSFTLT